MAEPSYIYLDHSATTPVRAEVVEAMLPYFTDHFANPSSVYAPSRAARRAIDRARETVAAALGCAPGEILFTSGGSEGDNLAIKGVAFAHQERGRHIITSAVEHHAVLHAAEYLERFGFRVTFLPVDRHGLVDPDELERALTSETTLVSLVWANNEIGTLQPIAEIGARLRERSVLFHTDAVQVPGHLPIDVRALNVDLLTLAAHKFYGPKGVGALYVRRGVRFLPQQQGGSQEGGRRAGTENTPGIVGLATALELATRELPEVAPRLSRLRDRLIAAVLRIEGARLTGHPTERLPGHASFVFEGVDGDALLMNLDRAGICASSGSACASGALEPSHVLRAIGVPETAIHGALRLTCGRTTTDPEVDRVLEVLPGIIAKLRALSRV